MIAALALTLFLCQPRQENAEQTLKDIEKIESLLRDGRRPEAAAAAKALVAALPDRRLVWWMFRERQERFADVVDKLAAAGETESACAFSVAIAGLLPHAGKETMARIEKVVAASPAHALEFKRRMELGPDYRETAVGKTLVDLERIEALLQEGKKADARAAALALVDALPARKLTWSNFRGEHHRLADLAEHLAAADQADAARAFAVSVAPLLSFAEEATQDRILKIVRGSPDEAFDLLRHSNFSQDRVGLTEEDVSTIFCRRLDQGKATEADALFWCRRVASPAMIRKAVGTFPKSWQLQEALGNAAFRIERYEEAARAFAASLELSGDPQPTDRNLGEEVEEFDGRGEPPRLVKLAISVLRDKNRDAAEAAVAEHASAAYLLNVADAYHEIGSFAKSAALYRKWMATHPPKDKDKCSLYVRLAGRAVEGYAKAGMAREAYLIRRAYLSSTIVSEPRHRDALAKADEVIAGLPMREVIDGCIADLVAASGKPAEEERRKAGDLLPQLSDGTPEVREDASSKLRAMGPGIAPVLWESAKSADAETRSRLREILTAWALKDAEARFLRQ